MIKNYSLLWAGLLISAFSIAAIAQVDDAREAISRGEYVRAVNILSDQLAQRPTPDTFLYLGIAYRRMKEYQKAQDVFEEGAQRYGGDARFHLELSNLFIENNDIERAKSELRQALAVEPGNAVASDQLATIDMSEGEVEPALRAWNKSGRPYINDILHNYYLNFSSWVVRRGTAFHPAGPLLYREWKTTESRLLETGLFSNVGLEIEPTPVPDQYNAVIRTTAKTNSLGSALFDIVKGLPIQTTYLDIWNINNSGINFSGKYRWDADRRRAEGTLRIPLPIGGLTHLELGESWRSERWDLSNTIRSELQPQAQFDYKTNALRVGVKHIPTYRVEIGAALEYRNRAARGPLPALAIDSSNTGRFTLETNLRLVDGPTYQNRLHLEAFAARPSLIGDNRFQGGVAGLDNRVTLSRDQRTYFDWTIKGGSVRGGVPVDDYFLLGIDTRPANLLRGHTATRNDKYGYGPIGTDFVLWNSDIERRLKTIPLFDSFSIPYLVMKWELFFDAGKTWDRQRVFKPSKLLLDTGAGLRFETPTHSFNLVYGRGLREGRNVFYAYYERRLWR